MRNLFDCYLYGILDLGYVAPSKHRQVAEAMLAGGVDLLQLRAKEASIDRIAELAADLYPVTAAANVSLVVNDHPEIANEVPVQGVHVGQDDLPISAVRDIVDRPIWVGKSTHSREQAIAACKEGADYIGFGPIYSTPTKPDYVPIGLSDIEPVHTEVMIPVFCIGGIKLQNLPNIISAGAKRAVIVSGLLLAKDITAYARSCKNLLQAARQIAPASL